MAKKPQALKFTEDLENDLKFLAGKKGMNYNNYVESVLSGHVMIQKKAIKAMAESKVEVEQKEEEWV